MQLDREQAIRRRDLHFLGNLLRDTLRGECGFVLITFADSGQQMSAPMHASSASDLDAVAITQAWVDGMQRGRS